MLFVFLHLFLLPPSFYKSFFSPSGSPGPGLYAAHRSHKVDFSYYTVYVQHAAHSYWLEVNPVGATNDPTSVPGFPVVVGLSSLKNIYLHPFSIHGSVQWITRHVSLRVSCVRNSQAQVQVQ